MDIKKKIQQLSAGYLEEVIAIRRHIHANPELSFKEFDTAEYVAGKLTEFQIPFKKGIAGTGIVATVEGRNPSAKTIALRADLDALPIKEANELEYRSKNEGVMHACGHDAHAASLIGAARILSELKDEFEGRVKFIFQPGEEKVPGGASLMIKEGVLENPVPDCIIAQHVFPELEAGKVGFRAGMYMASTDELYVTVKGKGGHGALPDQNVDPVLIAAHLIVALQQIVSRNARPDIPSVLSFGKVIADGSTNVIPDVVEMEGTFRTMDEAWREEAHHKMKQMATQIAQSMGGNCEFNIVKGYPFLVNDEATTLKAKKLAVDYLGEANVVELDLRMTSEDFAWYSQQLPACLYRLGVRNEAQGITSGLHTSTFNIDEKALETAMGLMAWIAVN